MEQSCPSSKWAVESLTSEPSDILTPRTYSSAIGDQCIAMCDLISSNIIDQNLDRSRGSSLKTKDSLLCVEVLAIDLDET